MKSYDHEKPRKKRKLQVDSPAKVEARKKIEQLNEQMQLAALYDISHPAYFS